MANKKPKTLDKTQRAGFDKGQPQPTSEQKKAGRERRRQAQRILDHMMKMGSMTKQERLEYVKKNPDELQIDELINVKYMEEILKGKLLVDRMNRHIPYAPQKTEITGEDGGPIERIESASKEELINFIRKK